MPSKDLRAPLSGLFLIGSNPSQAETEQIVDLSIREMISLVYTPVLLFLKAVTARLLYQPDKGTGFATQCRQPGVLPFALLIESFVTTLPKYVFIKLMQLLESPPDLEIEI